MEQLQNSLLTALQAMTLQQFTGKGGKTESAEKDDFQKLLERAKNPENVEQPKDAQKPQTAPDRKDASKAEGKEETAGMEEGTVQEAEDPQVRWDRLVKEGVIVPVGEFVDDGTTQELRVMDIDMETGEQTWVTMEAGRFVPNEEVVGGRLETAGMEQPRVMEAQAEVQAAPQAETAAQEVPAAEIPAPESEAAPQPQQQPLEKMEAQTAQVETAEGQEDGDVETAAAAANEPQAVFRDVEAAPIKVSDTAAPEESRQAPDVGQQVDNGLMRALQQGESRVQIDLTPEHLGSVRVEITHTADGGLHVALSAENGETRGLLERHVGQLQSLLSSQGRENVQVEVPRQQESQQNQNQQQYDGRSGHGGQPQQEEERQQRRHPQRGNHEDFLHQLRLGLISTDEPLS